MSGLCLEYGVTREQARTEATIAAGPPEAAAESM